MNADKGMILHFESVGRLAFNNSGGIRIGGAMARL